MLDAYSALPTATEPDVECSICSRPFYSADSISDDAVICPRHKRAPRRRRPAAAPIHPAIAAVRAEHAALMSLWYPGDERRPPSYFTTDREADERAIAAAPRRQFGWIVTPSSTHMIMAGDQCRTSDTPRNGWRWRCLTCGHTGVTTTQAADAAPPARCPSCDSERSANHGPQITCNAGAIVARAYAGNPIRFYAWDGGRLVAIADAATFDERITELGSEVLS
jgi:DNA-directed RNA polymerase subunit RPC12/RpoP